MDYLHSILKVSFVPVPTCSSTSAAAPSPKGEASKLKVVSSQILRFRLTITYDNEEGDVEKEQTAQAFLALVGIHSLEAAWTYLFSTVQFVPFFVSKSEATPVHSGPRALLSQKVSSPAMSSVPCLLSNTGNNFVFGVPAFWSNHSYTRANRAVEALEYVYGTLRGSSPTGMFASTNLQSLVDLQMRIPYCTTTAFPSCSNSSGNSTGDANAESSCGTTGMRCEVIGKVQTVSAGVNDPCVVSASGAHTALPKRLESGFTVELALPDLEAASLRGMDTTLVMVVLLPLSFDYTRMADPVDPNQPSVLRSVLAHSLGHTHVETAAAAALVLGSGVIPVEFMESFLCLSSTSPLSNDRLVLNLSLTNVMTSAARLYSTSLDLHSSRVLRDGEVSGVGGSSGAALPGDEAEPHFTTSPLWGEIRPGADPSSMRTIDLLTKLVTLTPVVVGEERPPFILHPGETYSFEFVIEVLPQLCYLLNSRSLEYVYERYYAVPHCMSSRPRAEGGAAAAGGGGRGADGGSGERTGDGATQNTALRGGAATVFSNGSVVTDCYGEVVSANELRRLLSYFYVSHLFVYYDLVTERDSALSPQSHFGEQGSETLQHPPVDDQAHAAGLCLRYPAQWSFGT
ncbi:hypothetical protein ABL78_2526 [Leptomonas seymouri]|uniref:Uncharacterized protein n=1 Tax=Leptomonas seymouri TaxID=5684 RepID=A0A0N1HZ40_LEPSE|nr:hypothetical protein ABL78_2526 [Leptomonas seymouri]|eukprot:KPI88352.1 hypothetical protein ABL78_2526 [Leptomonas seymouri]